QRIVCPFRTTSNSQLMDMGLTRSQYLVLPVNTLDIPVIFQCPTFREVSRAIVPIYLITDKFVGIHHIHRLHNILHTERCSIRYLRLADTSFLGLDHDDSSRCPCTVDSYSRRVLEDVYRLYIVHIQRIRIEMLIGKAVNNKQWRYILCERTCPSDHDSSTFFSGLSIGKIDLYPCNTA